MVIASARSLLRVLLLSLSLSSLVSSHPNLEKRRWCIIPAHEDGTDDTPAIIEAFKTCKKHGHIVFQNKTYHIDQYMRTTGLVETQIDIHGTLLVRPLLLLWKCVLSDHSGLISGVTTPSTGWRINRKLGSKMAAQHGSWAALTLLWAALVMVHLTAMVRSGKATFYPSCYKFLV